MLSLSVAYSSFNLDLFLFSSFIRLLRINKNQTSKLSVLLWYLATKLDSDLTSIITEDELLLAVNRIDEYMDISYIRENEETDNQIVSYGNEESSNDIKESSSCNQLSFPLSFVDSFERILDSYLQVGVLYE